MQNEIFDLVKKYAASNVVHVENLLEGDNIMIFDSERSDIEEEILVFTNVGKYQITKINKSDFSKEDLKECYAHYVVADFGNGHDWILQSLNYDKLDSSFSFLEAIGWKFLKLETQIKVAVDNLIKNSINQGNINLKGLMSLIIREISAASEGIYLNFDRNQGEYKYPVYFGQNSRKMINDAMGIIARRQKKFINDLKKEYRGYVTEFPVKQQLQKNQEPQIFADDLGYTLFLKLHDLYKDHKAEEANYSFIWYALETNGLIICKQKMYINFLSKLDINISKINSVQKNEDNRKWETFKSLKAPFEN